MGRYVKIISRCYLWGVDLLMILVTLGTQDKSFVRLLKAIDKEIEKGTIKEEVIVQAGYTKYESKRLKMFDMIDKEELENLTKKADLIITHGGVGSILTALSYHKKIIATPRLSKYKEHTNDHQKQIIQEFAKRGYLLPLTDLSKLSKLLEKAKTFQPKEYKSNHDNFLQLIDSKITPYTSWYNRDKSFLLVSIINLIIFSLLAIKIDIRISLAISYLLSMIISYYLKIKANIITIIFFFAFDMLSILLLATKLSLSPFLAKFITNVSLIILYHIICNHKKN